jgi:DNA-binding LacI/PurR family transcriptional regulator
MPGPAPTLRSLAADLGLSRTTVSEALRGSSRVNAETAQRVRAAAERVGYRPNPLAGAVMAEIRRSRTALIRGTLAIVNVEETVRPKYAAGFQRELIRGATERAAKLGFSTDVFQIGEHGVPLRRLEMILQTRGILGVILLPVWGEPDFSSLDWSLHAGVYVDYLIEHPALNCVCCDHFRAMQTALQKVREYGYRRPGLFVSRLLDERLHHRWEGSFLAFQRHHADFEVVSPLVRDGITRDVFIDWFRTHRPDVVLGHDATAIRWMQDAGANVPAEAGFICLNQHMQTEPVAGLDQQPALLGGHAADLVVAQLYRNEHGAPANVSMTNVPARWVDGPSFRPRVKSGAGR